MSKRPILYDNSILTLKRQRLEKGLPQKLALHPDINTLFLSCLSIDELVPLMRASKCTQPQEIAPLILHMDLSPHQLPFLTCTDKDLCIQSLTLRGFKSCEIQLPKNVRVLKELFFYNCSEFTLYAQCLKPTRILQENCNGITLSCDPSNIVSFALLSDTPRSFDSSKLHLMPNLRSFTSTGISTSRVISVHGCKTLKLFTHSLSPQKQLILTGVLTTNLSIKDWKHVLVHSSRQIQFLNISRVDILKFQDQPVNLPFLFPALKEIKLEQIHYTFSSSSSSSSVVNQFFSSILPNLESFEVSIIQTFEETTYENKEYVINLENFPKLVFFKCSWKTTGERSNHGKPITLVLKNGLACERIMLLLTKILWKGIEMINFPALCSFDMTVFYDGPLRNPIKQAFFCGPKTNFLVTLKTSSSSSSSSTSSSLSSSLSRISCYNDQMCCRSLNVVTPIPLLSIQRLCEQSNLRNNQEVINFLNNSLPNIFQNLFLPQHNMLCSDYEMLCDKITPSYPSSELLNAVERNFDEQSNILLIDSYSIQIQITNSLSDLNELMSWLKKQQEGKSHQEAYPFSLLEYVRMHFTIYDTEARNIKYDTDLSNNLNNFFHSTDICKILQDESRVFSHVLIRLKEQKSHIQIARNHLSSLTKSFLATSLESMKCRLSSVEDFERTASTNYSNVIEHTEIIHAEAKEIFSKYKQMSSLPDQLLRPFNRRLAILRQHAFHLSSIVSQMKHIQENYQTQFDSYHLLKM